jgi:hypothetical protein
MSVGNIGRTINPSVIFLGKDGGACPVEHLSEQESEVKYVFFWKLIFYCCNFCLLISLSREY